MSIQTMNERGYEALNIKPRTKTAFDSIKENEPYPGTTQDALMRHLMVEAGYGDHLDEESG